MPFVFCDSWGARAKLRLCQPCPDTKVWFLMFHLLWGCLVYVYIYLLSYPWIREQCWNCVAKDSRAKAKHWKTKKKASFPLGRWEQESNAWAYIYMSTEILTRETLGMMCRGQNTRCRMWPRVARRRRLQQEGSAQGAGESASVEPFLHAFHVKCVAAPP